MSRLALSLLGSLQATVNDSPVTTFGSDKVRALLAFLAVESGHPHRRDALIGLFWPDSPQDVARANLRQALYCLRRAIHDQTGKPPHLIITRDAIQFNTASDYTLDVAAFQAHLAACVAHKHRQATTCAECAFQRQQAVELYRGKFLEDFFLADSAEFEEWALIQREALHRSVLEALADLVRYHEQRSEYAPARRYAHRQLEMDPWREEAHRQMMRVLAASGQRSEAIAQYETCRRVLAGELGVEPSAETRELYAQISRDEWSTTPEVPPALQISTGSLPLALTPFVGREDELIQLRQLLTDPRCRLLTLVGAGGIGKTRLALQAATGEQHGFDHGAVFVPLASVPAPEAILPAIADALGQVLASSSNPEQQILRYLRDRQLLIVLDNLEHLLDGVDLFVKILQHAPAVKLLCTSRESLHLQSEWVVDVDGLAVPANEQTDRFEAYSAVALFLLHARRANAGYTLTAEERPGVARICRLVGGLPLALELAATWVRILSSREIADQIEKNLDFLKVSLHDVPERHHSVRAVFDQSWKMLTTPEQLVMRKLSVFHGFTQEAASQVAGTSISVLASLVGKSLVRRAGGRYYLHDLVRQYAREHLIESGEFEATLSEYSRFYVEFAEAVEPKLKTAEQPIWLNRLDGEADNLRGALGWSLHYQGANAEDLIERGLRLAGALWQFWLVRGHVQEGRQWLALALEKGNGGKLGTSRARAKALIMAVGLADFHGDLASAIPWCEEGFAIARDLGSQHLMAAALMFLGDYQARYEHTWPRTLEHLTEALSLARQLGDKWLIALTLEHLGIGARSQGNAGRAWLHLEESLVHGRQVGDPWLISGILDNLGSQEAVQGNYDRADRLYDEALRLRRQLQDPGGVAGILNDMGQMARYQEDYVRAARFFEESLALFTECGQRESSAIVLHNLGCVTRQHGDLARAATLFGESLSLFRELENTEGIINCLAGLAGVACAQGQVEDAVKMLATVDASLESTGAAIPLVERADCDEMTAVARSKLPRQRFAAAWAEGGRMTIEQAVAYAQEVLQLESHQAPASRIGVSSAFHS